MHKQRSFVRSTTAEDGDMALALALEQAESQRAVHLAEQPLHNYPVSTLTGEPYHNPVASIRTTTAEPAPWIDDDDRLQRAVSQRLGSVKYSRHLPRVNSEPLSPEDSSTARARLLSRLDMYGLCEVAVHGDGNCQVGVTRYFVSVLCSRCSYCMQKCRQPQSAPQVGLDS
ncbi:TPA: hypothetical protein ACH3X3_15286 [Trebouxia sp. C0006]